MLKISSMFLLMALVSGCASMFSGSKQEIVVKSENGAEIFINDRFAGKGLVKRKVERDESHIIRVEKDGCQSIYKTESRFNKLSLLGLLVDAGLLSIPVDFSTGAAWDVYPNKIQLVPECEKAALN